MSKSDSKKKRIRIGLIVILILLVLLTGIQLFFSFYLDTYVENRLTALVTKQTDGQYELKMDELDLSVWGRSFEMENIHLHPADTASTAPKIDMEEFSINGIQFFSYLFRGDIQVGEIELSAPHVTLVQNSPDSLTFLKSSGRSSHKNIKPPVIEADQFDVENASLNYWKTDQTETRGELHDFEFSISEIQVDSASLAKAPFITFGNVQTSSGKIHYELNSGLYAFETTGINFSTAKPDFFGSIDSLQLIPQYPRYEFYQAVGHQTDRIDLIVEEILFQNPDIEKMKEGEFKLQKLSIEKADLNVFRSKELPRADKSPKKLAHVAFKELEIPVTIDTISVNETNISYTEKKPKVSETGTVTFANLNGTFTDVTNDSTALSQGHNTKLDVTAYVMNEARLEAHFVFPMHKNGAHTARGTLGSMDTDQLNPILVPVGKIRAESGTIHSLAFDMNLGPEKSDGWVQLEYSDLKIEVLDAENVEEGGDQFFKTLLANLLKVKDSNNEEPLRRGEVSFERIEYKAIFNYWWKSLSSGLKDNIGI